MVVPELPAEWRPAVEAIAHHSRDMFRRHPWVLPIFQDVPAVTPNLLRHIEQSAVGRAARGVDPACSSSCAVDDFTIGFTLRELAESARRLDPRAPVCSRAASSRSCEFVARSPMPPPTSRWAEWLLDGFAAQLA